MTTIVPFAAFDRRYADWVDDLVDSVRVVAESDEFILRGRVSRLEEAIADRIGARHAIACASGTGALTLLLTGEGIGPGDEVVTPAFSFISSASAIALVGATPVFADVDPATFALDPESAAAAVTPRTRALLPAHLFCYTAPMAALRRVADTHGLRLVEDSAVTLGGQVDGRPTGRWGDGAIFSFFPAKPLGSCGDAGMLVTDDDALAAACRALRNHGQVERFRHDLVGFNCRMDEITAEFLLRRLVAFDAHSEARRSLARRYSERLRNLAPDVVVPAGGMTTRAIYTYVIRVQERDRLRAFLIRRGVETTVYYPRPLHLQQAFAHLGHGPGDFPQAEMLCHEALALPLYPELGPDEVDRVADAVAEFYRTRA